ncbi:hypothetical protein [Enterococcus ureasiticus]|uniref:Uncharacterized protein n=1 Tax=Enterococcus ureasiticus TaxID=903984 RepID=A0A1E5GE55_9ENTE|nr:hypothetical protein [Enterococcus ureasiticus]OEG10994.1 hypothetical protein BCR21_11985 [Enterococcus ureasiticus]
MKHSTTEETTGIIEEVFLVAPEVMKIYNSKWAIVSFTADGEKYVSENRIQVPMSCEVGSTIKIKYDIDHPTKVWNKSIFKF